MSELSLIEGTDGRHRCWWPGADPLYTAYHDEEWGRPVFDDVRLFEKLCLEGFQAGLSWLTILRKREHFHSAFAGFDFRKVAHFTEIDVERLLQNDGIIRHRGKIEATINNARRVCDMTDRGISLSGFLWDFAASSRAQPPKARADIPAKSRESEALSKTLKKQGFQFVGPTTMYALMQAMGMVNDHIDGCFVRSECNGAADPFKT